MTSMVRFRTGDSEYAVLISHTREVRSAEGIVPMPSAIAGVVGLLARDDEALTVTSLLGSGGHHVLVLDPGTLGRTAARLVPEQIAAVTGEDLEIPGFGGSRLLRGRRVPEETRAQRIGRPGQPWDGRKPLILLDVSVPHR